MPKDKTESHRKVIESAKQEFMEYGFENASMRRIGERIGMTAAGLYRHFPNKEEMFHALVEPAVNDMNAWMDRHASRSYRVLDSGIGDLWQDTEIDMMRELIYPRMSEYRMLLTKAQGTRYENFLHELVKNKQKKMMQFLQILKSCGYYTMDISENELHLLLSAYTTAMFEPVIHDYTLEEAFKCLETVEAFFMPGWKKLMGFQY